MKATIINDVFFSVDVDSLRATLHVLENSSYDEELLRLVKSAEIIGKPKAVYMDAAVRTAEEDKVFLEGMEFSGRLLRTNLNNVSSAIPFIATCGTELDQWSTEYGDILFQYWADAIKIQALHRALTALSARIDGYALQGLRSMMNPGSLEGWPIEEQGGLFRLFGDAAGTIGVTLSDSFLMHPTKSLSGIIYHSDTEFINCRLCEREKCGNRRAPYDEHLKRHYGQDGDMHLSTCSDG